jgi:hypothetical protein
MLSTVIQTDVTDKTNLVARSGLYLRFGHIPLQMYSVARAGLSGSNTSSGESTSSLTVNIVFNCYGKRLRFWGNPDQRWSVSKFHDVIHLTSVHTLLYPGQMFYAALGNTRKLWRWLWYLCHFEHNTRLPASVIKCGFDTYRVIWRHVKAQRFVILRSYSHTNTRTR